jgi:hypothetical protein
MVTKIVKKPTQRTTETTQARRKVLVSCSG